MYGILVDNGRNKPLAVQMTRQDLCRLVGGAIWQSVLASQAIEGVRVDDLPRPDITDLPEALLTTKGLSGW